MKCKSSYLLLCLLALFSAYESYSFEIVSNTNISIVFDDATKNILKKVDSACKSVASIKYRVQYQQPEVKVQADVFQEKGNVQDPVFGSSKVLVMGEKRIKGKTIAFKYSYDGKDFKFLESNKELLLIENAEGRAIGRTLGLDYYMVVRGQFGSDKGIDFLLRDRVKSSYVGMVKVNEKDAFHIKIINSYKAPGSDKEIKSETNWYFDKETYLPIKFVAGDGKSIHEVEILSVNKDLGVKFDINNNSLVEKKITGKEAKTDGLLEIGKSFPDFILKDLNGKTFNKGVFKKYKITIVDFWGTWCGPCLIAMPQLQELYNEYHDDGLNLIGISVNDKPNKPKAYVEQKGYTYQFLESGDDLARILKLDMYPTIFLIDSEGKVIYREKGKREGAKEDFVKIIEKYIR